MSVTAHNANTAVPAIEPGPREVRIMIKMLLDEAQRYHRAGYSKRAPAHARAHKNATSPSATPEPPASPAHGAHGHHPCHPYDAVTTEEDLDAWADIQAQIDAALSDPTMSQAMLENTYTRVKSYLTCLFLWDRNRAWSEFEDVSPAASMRHIADRQQRRLDSLPAGCLFHA